MDLTAASPPLPTAAAPDIAAGAATAPASPEREAAAAPGRPELSEADQRRVADLKRRDTEVRRHETAHKTAAGSLATGGPNYTYETGPDGRRYAVEGNVSIDTNPVPGDPEATIRKARQIAKAALAPQDPSQQDLKVAAKARRMELEARQELARLQSESEAAYGRDGQRRPGGADALVDITV